MLSLQGCLSSRLGNYNYLHSLVYPHKVKHYQFQFSQELKFHIRRNKSYRANKPRSKQTAHMLPPICYHPYATAHMTLPVTSGTSGPEEKNYCRSDSKAVKMAIIHCKFKLGPQWLLPTILLSSNLDLKCSQTLLEPFFL